MCNNAVCGDGLVCSDGTCTSGPSSGPEDCDTVTTSESCDMGTTDRCSTPSCGDGFINGPAGEQCDDGNVLNSDACTAGCAPATCGDGFRCTNASVCTTGPNSGIEECDGSDVGCLGGETCSLGTCDCTSTTATTVPVCGDGVINGTEECDDPTGNSNNRPCRANCTNNVCGDNLQCSHISCSSGPGGGVEFCDGTQDTQCPGFCDGTCACTSPTTLPPPTTTLPPNPAFRGVIIQ
jgi:cysteine-rich repeat protein